MNDPYADVREAIAWLESGGPERSERAWETLRASGRSIAQIVEKFLEIALDSGASDRVQRQILNPLFRRYVGAKMGAM